MGTSDDEYRHHPLQSEGQVRCKNPIKESQESGCDGDIEQPTGRFVGQSLRLGFLLLGRLDHIDHLGQVGFIPDFFHGQLEDA